jgi:hypothetical protein
MTTTVPPRVFLPLADSPLIRPGRFATEDAQYAVDLAAAADPTPALVAALLSITRSDPADRIAAALDQRSDLPATVLAMLVTARPDAHAATARLKELLFPAGNGCHRFSRTIAALAHRPDTLDPDFLGSAQFADSAPAADPAVLHDVLAPLLSGPSLTGHAITGLAALLAARRRTQPGTAPVDLAIETALTRARLAELRAPLIDRRGQVIAALAGHTGGLTLAVDAWYDALIATVDTPEHAARALDLADHTATALADGKDLDCPWPAVRRRWHQVRECARTQHTHPAVWARAWNSAATTQEGSVWDPVQRGLVAGYDLLTDHVRVHHPDGDPGPQRCWAADSAGRTLLHTIADHLAGHDGHSPLPHFDDALLIRFIQALATERRDRIPGELQVHGLIAAVKAARSKAYLHTVGTTRIGIAIPTRGEAHRLPAPDTGHGDNALTTKIAQLRWLLDARPDIRVDILLVDEDPDSASAHAAAQIDSTHSQIRLTVAARPAGELSAKGGAVLWGLGQLLDAGATTLAYTDLDLTYPLDQLGLLLHPLDQPGTAAVVGSRRLASSYGYYPRSGPEATVRLYQKVVHELLGVDVADPQAGFKAFTAQALRTALPEVVDYHLSFDSELLAVLRKGGHTIVEVGVAALHRYVNGHVGTPRDYDTMLTAVQRQAARHGLTAPERATPVLDRIRAAGSLAAAAAKVQTGSGPGRP